MGVEYYVCKNCGETFSDCGEFVICDCGEHWCSDWCAEADGYVPEHCSIHTDLGSRDLMEKYRKEHCEYDDCVYCKFYESAGCNYCRKEDYDDYTLLNKALELLGLSRDDLIKEINEGVSDR